MTTPAPLPQLFLPLNTPVDSLKTVGGKGANLARLTNAGFPVPAGFTIPTAVYREFLADNDLASQIESALQAIDPKSLDDLAAASAEIRAQFRIGSTPAGLLADLENRLALAGCAARCCPIIRYC